MRRRLSGRRWWICGCGGAAHWWSPAWRPIPPTSIRVCSLPPGVRIPAGARLWPLSVDGLVLLASIGLLRTGAHTSPRNLYTLWAAFGLGIAVSLAPTSPPRQSLDGNRSWSPAGHRLPCCSPSNYSPTGQPRRRPIRPHRRSQPARAASWPLRPPPITRPQRRGRPNSGCGRTTNKPPDSRHERTFPADSVSRCGCTGDAPSGTSSSPPRERH